MFPRCQSKRTKSTITIAALQLGKPFNEIESTCPHCSWRQLPDVQSPLRVHTKTHRRINAYVLKDGWATLKQKRKLNYYTQISDRWLETFLSILFSRVKFQRFSIVFLYGFSQKQLNKMDIVAKRYLNKMRRKEFLLRNIVQKNYAYLF